MDTRYWFVRGFAVVDSACGNVFVGSKVIMRPPPRLTISIFKRWFRKDLITSWNLLGMGREMRSCS